MTTAPIPAVIAYLKSRFTDSTSHSGVATRIFGEEWPEDDIPTLGRKENAPAILVKTDGGQPRLGPMVVDELSMSFFVVGYSYQSAHEVNNELTQYLERFRTNGGGAHGIVSAWRNIGPLVFRDEDYRWHTVMTTWVMCFRHDPG